MQSAWNRGALNPLACRILVGIVALGAVLAGLIHQPWIPIEIRQPESGVLAAMPAPMPFEVRRSSEAEAKPAEIEQAAAQMPHPAHEHRRISSGPSPKQTAEVEVAEVRAVTAPSALREISDDRDAISQQPAAPPTVPRKVEPPTVLYRLPTPFQVPVSETGVTWNFVIPTGVQQDLFLTGVELKPGQGRLVKRMVLSYDATGQARAKDQQTRLPGFPVSGETRIAPELILAEWIKDRPAGASPRDAAQRIPSGADLILTIEYAPTPVAEEDPWTMGLSFLPRQKPITTEPGSLTSESPVRPRGRGIAGC